MQRMVGSVRSVCVGSVRHQSAAASHTLDKFDERAALYTPSRVTQYDTANRSVDARATERALMLQYLRLRPGLRCCDVAAGGGYVAEGIEEALSSACQITALENSHAFLELLPRRFNPTFSSLQRLALAAGSMDRVSCLAGLHHQQDKAAFFAEANRVLAPGGLVAVADVLIDSPPARWLNGPVDRATPIGHDGMFLKHGEIASLLLDAGFSVVREQPHEYTWDFDSRTQMVRYCKELFRMSKASVNEVEAQLFDTLDVREHADGRCSLNWMLLYASGIKPMRSLSHARTRTAALQARVPKEPPLLRSRACKARFGQRALSSEVEVDPITISNERYALSVRRGGGSWLEAVEGPLRRALGAGAHPLRLSVVSVNQRDREGAEQEAVVEATVVRCLESSARWAHAFEGDLELLAPRRRSHASPEPFAVVQIIPTGVGCEIGGYAGDAGPATNLLAAVSDVVITHPNAVNASELNEMRSNVLYVEGRSLDDFMLGYLGLLAQPRGNRIGTWIDPTGLGNLDDVINTLNAARAVKGVDCDTYTVLKRELGVHIEWSSTGCASGIVLRPSAILDSTKALLDAGATAIGGVSVIHGVTPEMVRGHLDAGAPNPSGGIEAIITHLISKVFRVPTAHAPLPYYQSMKAEQQTTSNPRASAEFISTPHYFCIAKGLSKAPQLMPLPMNGDASIGQAPAQALTLNNVAAVVAPASCLGGIPMLAAEFNGIPLIAVQENSTILNVDNTHMQMKNVLPVSSYMEAAGVLTALREGISIESVRRPLLPCRQI